MKPRCKQLKCVIRRLAGKIDTGVLQRMIKKKKFADATTEKLDGVSVTEIEDREWRRGEEDLG